MLPVTIAAPQSAGGLTLFPLLATGPATTAHDLLPDALEAGTVVITEVSEGGSVPELTATNHGPRDVLILDGMQLIGAKQNRTVGRSVLLAAGTTTRIPVSCMEQGRWHHRSAAMRSGLDHSSPKVRRRTRAVEAEQADLDLDGSGARPPNELLSMAQGQVWEAIRESSAKLGARSATDALDDVYHAARPRLETLAASFPLADGQVGFVAFLDGRAVGADAVHDPATYARLHERLVRGYLLDALEAGAAGGDGAAGAAGEDGPGHTEGATGGANGGPTAEHAHGFLDAAAGVERRPLPTVGRGEYRALAGAIVGGELEVDGDVLHLSAFQAEWM
jgi:hypothetical protein